MQHRFNCFLSIAIAAAMLAGPPASAAELGDIAVRTYLNQPLTADIELVMLTPEEAAEGVPVRMAGPNIYQGANVRMHPALAGARMSVQRKDQRLYVHLVTLQPVDTDVVHLYLELGNGSRAVVRAVTLWLTPEPPGAPRPPVVRPLPAQVAGAQDASPSSARAAAPLRPAPLPPPVEIVRPAAAPSRPASMPPAAATLPADASATSDPSLPGFAPSEAALIAARARAAAEREALMRRAAYGADLLKSAPQRSASGHAACVPGKSGDQARQCVALDQKNVELNAKIRDLEGKVQALQTAIGVPVSGGPAAGTAPVAGTVPAAPAAGAAPAASPASVAPVAPAGAAAATAPPASAAVASAPPAAPAPAASTPMNPAGAVIPPSNGSNGTNGKKERRSGLNTTTQIVLGVVAALTLLGGLTYLVRKNKLKLPSKEKLMFWKRWKRNKRDEMEEQGEPQEPVLDKDGE